MICPVLDAVCSKAKLSKKFPLDLCYGSSNWLDLRFDDLYIHQGYKKISFFIEQRISHSLSGPLVRASYKWVLLYVGIEGYGLFDLDFDCWGRLLP